MDKLDRVLFQSILQVYGLPLCQVPDPDLILAGWEESCMANHGTNWVRRCFLLLCKLEL